LAEAFLGDSDYHVVLAVRSMRSAAESLILQREHRDRTTVVEIDYRDVTSIQAAARRCMTLGRIDYLINCGGVNKVDGTPPAAGKGPVAAIGEEVLAEMFQVNVVGPILTCREFIPLLRRSAYPTIVNVSTSRASIGLTKDGGAFCYAVTKAALNMATRKLAFEPGLPGLCAVALDPGWVSTRMGGPRAPTTPQAAAAQIKRTILSLCPATSGRMIDRHGDVIAW
jgi:NAD(P)-dependent dehydrogenase (short-subunit alcohol dehydrogenase family)